MFKLNQYVSLLLIMVVLQSCGTYFNQPYQKEAAKLGETTKVTERLVSLPKPQEPVVVGVYKFRDQTGQYKAIENGSSFSTAVTQGATTILIKALEDSKWFTPIERENFSNLNQERNIIKSTRQQYRRTTNPNEPLLDPLLYAGVLLEGGIISYDSNIITGGFGARYFGVGGSTQYRQDRITVYLRAISTKNGKILKTVYVSKTILSQAIDASVFRYVNFKRLLEVETGITKNEPGQMAVTEAIEKAVEALIIEGIEDELWYPVASEEQTKKLIENYNYEKNDALNTEIYDRLLEERRGKYGITAALGVSRISGDLPNPEFEFNSKLGVKRYVNPFLNINFTFNKFGLANKQLFNEGYMSFDLNAEYNFLPFDRLTPFAYAGMGSVAANHFESIDAKVQFGAGIEYLVTNNLGLNLYVEHNTAFSDKLDFIEAGTRDDMFYRGGLGLTYYLDRPESGSNIKREEAKALRQEQKRIKRENLRKNAEQKKANREAIKSAKKENKTLKVEDNEN